MIRFALAQLRLTTAARAVKLVAIAALLVGCANTTDRVQDRLAWTDGNAQRYNLAPHELRDLQFWVSDDIHLRRLTTAGQRDIEGGRLVERSAKSVDEIIIKRGTPGVAVGSGHDWIAVSFEPGSYLYFTARRNGMLLAPTHSGRSGPGDLYYLWAQDWRGGKGIVPVNGQTNGVLYEATPASADSFLLVERRAVAESQRNRHVQQGREVWRR